MQKNQQAMAIAIRRAVAKSKKIKELGITPNMTVEQIDTLILALSAKKDVTERSSNDVVKGQEWYVNDLKAFSALSAQDRLDHEYAVAFPEVAEPEEALDMLEAIMAA
jgi:hypothetical protein